MTLKKRQKTDYIVIHCSKTSQTEDIGINELKAKFIDEGWSDIGYHYVIRRDGTLEEGREVESVGGHLFGWDSVCLGICLVGGIGPNNNNTETTNYTEAQTKTLIELLVKTKSLYPAAQIVAPFDFPGVSDSSPFFDVKEWLKTIPELNKG